MFWLQRINLVQLPVCFYKGRVGKENSATSKSNVATGPRRSASGCSPADWVEVREILIIQVSTWAIRMSGSTEWPAICSTPHPVFWWPHIFLGWCVFSNLNINTRKEWPGLKQTSSLFSTGTWWRRFPTKPDVLVGNYYARQGCKVRVWCRGSIGQGWRHALIPGGCVAFVHPFRTSKLLPLQWLVLNLQSLYVISCILTIQ